jgi:hypothetical protein
MTVVGAVFGQWHPPFWLRAIGHGLANLGNKARAYPRQAGAGVLGLVLLAAAVSMAGTGTPTCRSRTPWAIRCTNPT